MAAYAPTQLFSIPLGIDNKALVHFQYLPSAAMMGDESVDLTKYFSKIICVVGAHPFGTAPQNGIGGAYGTGTVAFSDVPLTGETVTIGSIEYTLKDALSVGPAVENEVLIGASATATGDNLAAAVNGDAGEGTTYSTGTVANSEVTAVNLAGTVTLTAVDPGTAIAAGIALSESASNTTVSGAALTGASNDAPAIWFRPNYDGTENAAAATDGLLGVQASARQTFAIVVLGVLETV